MKQSQYRVFYKSNGKWTPVRTDITNKPRTFTSVIKLNQFLNSADFTYTKNRVLKSAITVRKLKS